MSAPVTPALSRRKILASGAALGVAVPLAGLGIDTTAADDGENGHRHQHDPSVKAAIQFLQGVTDAYRTTGFRLAQSYQDDSGLDDIAFIYDNALTPSPCCRPVTWLGHGPSAMPCSTPRATTTSTTTIGCGRPITRRLRRRPDDAISGYQFGLTGTAVGDMAWSGIALAQLAQSTRRQTYLTGATRIGSWIVDNTYSTTGLGGYTFGATAGLEEHKSTEHNIDVYGFFRLLARLTGDTAVERRADHAWASSRRCGTPTTASSGPAPTTAPTINKNPVQLPQDVQTWSWLAVAQGEVRGGAGLGGEQSGDDRHPAADQLGADRQLLGQRRGVRQRHPDHRHRRHYRRAVLQPEARRRGGLVRGDRSAGRSAAETQSGG